jgi:hypothetical protein
MRTAILSSLIVISCCGLARAEVYEIPLPVTGEYAFRERRDFSIDLGFPLLQVHSVKFRAEGTIMAPVDFWDVPPSPANGAFIAALVREDMSTTAGSPPAGRATYPEPEPFAGVGSFPEQTWQFLLDGSAEGSVYFGLGQFIRGAAAGGQGVLTTASLVIDATPVPEPGLLAAGAAALAGLAGRRRRIE